MILLSLYIILGFLTFILTTYYWGKLVIENDEEYNFIPIVFFTSIISFLWPLSLVATIIHYFITR
jgi:hypothetical protein